MPPARRRLMLACLGLAGFVAALPFAAPPAAAQTSVIRVRGTIQAHDGATLTVVSREGPVVSLSLPADLAPTALRRLSMQAITPNSFVATVAAPADDGTLRSTYVLVFPESRRGTGEGHYDWDLGPGSSMTNATVTSMVQASAGRKLTLVYKGTPIDVVVPPDAPVLESIPASRDDLKPGARVFITATRTADGSLAAQRVTVSKDGVDPPQ